MRKFYGNVNMLLRKFSLCSYDVKCKLFRSFCVNLYCPYFWHGRTKCFLKKLKTCYNNGLRRLLNIPRRNSASEMFVNLNIPSFDELLRKCVNSFTCRLFNCNCNTLISAITRPSVVLTSVCHRWWFTILH